MQKLHVLFVKAINVKSVMRVKLDLRLHLKYLSKAHIIKYVVENIREVANDIRDMDNFLNLTPKVIEINSAQFEIVQISSLGGVYLDSNGLDELDTPDILLLDKNDNSKQGWMT